jgi:hypothetical protein
MTKITVKTSLVTLVVESAELRSANSNSAIDPKNIIEVVKEVVGQVKELHNETKYKE